MTEHSTTPWQLCHHLESAEKDASCKCGYRGGIWGDEGEILVCEMRNCDLHEGHEMTPVGDRATQLANAAFIIKAVNNHDALIEALHEARMALFKIRACSIVGCEQGYGKPELWADALFASHGDVAKALKTIDAALTQPASAVGALPPRASSQPAESAGAKTGGGK